MRILLAGILVAAIGTVAAADASSDLIGTKLVVTASAEDLPEAVRVRLSATVSVRWNDTPIDEVSEIIRSATSLNLIVDPKLLAAGRTVTLTAERMPVDSLLRWLGRLAGVHTGWRDGALYLAADQPALRPVTVRYDVADLLHAVPDFPGPELEVPAPGTAAVKLIPPIERPAPADGGRWLVDLINTQIRCRTSP
ncbi:hypothetical protein LBMAG53_33670 [Planctomycetota bacterium]|nr:hypothetical protein LBMAG53_33670 [Planctomycetota bacterium]